ncbi:exodeoxyribonuclease I [Salinibius halmophilus]|uniref:exodeoxyribonuclease I n=1 Tax=Salinibius halmophilus TaxID=1853216 RepID=UPI0013140B25|nr:exodeoxyribonuclease I [Salinibius halmophilus]
MSNPSILWYDFETFGADAKLDSPAQFAAQRTDHNLMPIDSPEIFYCQPLADRMISPDAVAITGITPQHAQQNGVPEYQFAERVHALMAQPNTTTCGYNTIRFDDEVCRHMFWRNMIDPYGREFKNNNARFDLLDVMRLTSALRPEGLYWPKRDDGLPSYKLEQLSVANGIEHTDAHDAMADVRATIALAQKVRRQQEKLWHYVFEFRYKHRAKGFLEQLNGAPFLHASGKVSAEFFGTTVLVPLLTHPTNRNEIICWDARVAPQDCLDASAKDLNEWLYAKSSELPEDVVRPGFKSVHVNKAPMMAPMSLFDEAVSKRIQISETQVRQCVDYFQSHDWQSLVVEVFSQPFEAEDKDPEQDLYGGFISMHDRQLMDKMRALPAEEWSKFELDLGDPRLAAIAVRLRARYFPHTLTQSEQSRWQAYLEQRTSPVELQSLIKQVRQRKKIEPERSAIWQALLDWYQTQLLRVDSPQLSLF